MAKFSIQLLFVFLLFIIAGCKNGFTPGHYEGTLHWQDDLETRDAPVGIDVSYQYGKWGFLSKTQGSIVISNEKGRTITSLTVSMIDPKKFKLMAPDIYPEAFTLEKIKTDPKNKEKACYSSTENANARQANSWFAEVCLEKEDFRLRILNPEETEIFKLNGDIFKKKSNFNLETPVEFLLDQAIQKALEANLDSRIGFEHIIQAKLSVTAGYLNLIPHLTTNLIWNAQPGYISVIATLQGLVPFLLPTYWLQTKENEFDLKIKRDAEALIKANLAAMVEQLSYAFDRDDQILQLQSKVIQQLLQFQEKVIDLEEQGQLHTGAAESLLPLLNKIQSNHDQTAHLVKEDQYTISQALGFHNPEAVIKVHIPEIKALPSVKPLKKEGFAQIAIHRSFELQQIEYLAEIAKLKKTEFYFAWIDPTGDPKTSLGLNTIAQVKIAKSQLKEIGLKHEQLQTTLYQNAYRVVDEYNANLSFLNQLKKNSETTKTDLNQILTDMFLHNGFVLETIYNRTEDFLSEEIGYLANQAAYRIAKSKVDRIMLAGYYDLLLPHLDSTRLELSSMLSLY